VRFEGGVGVVGMYLRTVVESIRRIWYVGPRWMIVLVLEKCLEDSSLVETDGIGGDMKLLLA